LVIFLLLAANFQSMRLSFVVFTTAPAAVCGMILMLLITHTTLNIESYMGGIMAIGVGTANAILLVTFAEEYRKQGASSLDAGVEGARERMRPIIMTSVAMISGMVPMALAISGQGRHWRSAGSHFHQSHGAPFRLFSGTATGRNGVAFA
jgi:multidrug efflux pump subunit AcrB